LHEINCDLNGKSQVHQKSSTTDKMELQLSAGLILNRACHPQISSVALLIFPVGGGTIKKSLVSEGWSQIFIRLHFFFFFLSLYVFPLKGALGYEVIRLH